MQIAYAYPLVPVANIISGILTLIPLPWLLQHWNTGAWTHAIWSALLCFIVGVNTILWSDNMEIKAVAWCDITVRIFHAGSLAIVTSNFVMTRRACLIMHIQSPISEPQKTRAKLFDLFFCVAVPVISMGLSWFIQGHRFNIIEGVGCYFAYYSSPLFVALYDVWTIIFAILCAIYGCFIFRALIRRRNALREVTLVDPDISFEQFRRVIALGCTECLLTLPCSVFVFVNNLLPGLEPWRGLGDAHYDFSAIWQVPAVSLNRRDVISIQWNIWITVFVAIVFFLFFGLSGAMWNDYWKGIVVFARRFGINLPSRITRARSSKDQKTFMPPMVFKVRTKPQTSIFSSRITGTVQQSDLDVQTESDSGHAFVIEEGQQIDLEKATSGIVGISSVGNSKEKIRHSLDESVHVEIAHDIEKGSTDVVSIAGSIREHPRPTKRNSLEDRRE